MAAIGGIMATLLFESVEGEERRWASILLLISIFITSIGLAKLLKIQFHKSEKKKIITTGIGSLCFYLLVHVDLNLHIKPCENVMNN